MTGVGLWGRPRGGAVGDGIAGGGSDKTELEDGSREGAAGGGSNGGAGGTGGEF